MKRLFIFLLCLWPCLVSAESALPRVVIAFYDKARYPTFTESDVHKLAEMPLNHLGLVLEYHDINEALPEIASRADVRGVLTWFGSDTAMEDPEGYLNWAEKALAAGKRFVVIENPAFDLDIKGNPTPPDRMDRFLTHLGVSSPEKWIEHTFGAKLEESTPGILPDLGGVDTLPSYGTMVQTDRDARVHLAIRPQPDAKSTVPLIVTTGQGGIVAEGYASYHTSGPNEIIQRWMFNPFLFFRSAFATDELPKPDTTTLAGRRIYYSHIDGDGWRNMAQFAENGTEASLAAKLILDQVVRPYPDLPVTLTLIAADVDQAWLGTPESIKLAKEFLSEPQVEAGTHTFTHPFNWAFFEDANPEKERPYLSRYESPVWAGRMSRGWWNKLPAVGALKGRASHDHGALPEGYTVPRAYALKQFDIKQEVQGSVDVIAKLLPEGKKVELLTWSGDTSPYEEAVKLTQEAGLANINGGDTRFDPEYPDLACVAPVGRQVGKYWQIYSSMSNENTYTNLWTGRFYGFGYVTRTFANTGQPRRLKPMNLYYHLYAGEKEASFRSLIDTLNYVRTQEVAPIVASRYSHIAQGFYSAQLTPQGENAWRVDNRGDLQTLRFDEASNKSVDFARSQGVIGQRHSQGSLYVYLDAEVTQPVVALQRGEVFTAPPSSTAIYLVESRWPVEKFSRSATGAHFKAQGFGKGEMTWRVPHDGRYRVRMEGEEPITATASRGLLTFELPAKALNGADVTIEGE